MKTRRLTAGVLIVALSGLFAGVVLAEGAKGEGWGPHGRRGGRGRGRMGPNRQKILKEFDKDGDGKLDEAERKAAREAMKAKREAFRKKMLEKFDKDKDGKISQEERKAAREAFFANLKENHPELFKRLDTNNDGTLSDEEKAKARRMRSGRRGGPGGQPPKVILAKFDKDKDGKLNEAERKAAREAFWSGLKERNPELFKRIDADGDGVISDEEKTEARKKMHRRRGGRGRRHGGEGRRRRGGDKPEPKDE